MYFDAKTKGYFPQNIKSIIKVEAIFFCLKILRLNFFLLIVLGYTLCNWNTLVCCISISCPPPSVFFFSGGLFATFSPYWGGFFSIWGPIHYFFVLVGAIFSMWGSFFFLWWAFLGLLPYENLCVRPWLPVKVKM